MVPCARENDCMGVLKNSLKPTFFPCGRKEKIPPPLLFTMTVVRLGCFLLRSPCVCALAIIQKVGLPTWYSSKQRSSGKSLNGYKDASLLLGGRYRVDTSVHTSFLQPGNFFEISQAWKSQVAWKTRELTTRKGNHFSL